MKTLWIFLALLAASPCASQDALFNAKKLLRQYESMRQNAPTQLQTENVEDFWEVFKRTPASQLDLRQCFQDAFEVLSDLNSTNSEYALRMLDSNGKAQGGLFNGNFRWLGFYEECTEAKKIEDGQVKIQGKHCKVPGNALPGGLGYMNRIGICVPDSCNATDLELIYPNPGNIPIKCVEDVPWITGDYVTLGICGVISLVILVGTILDLVLRISKEKSTTQKAELPEPTIQLKSLKLAADHPASITIHENSSPLPTVSNGAIVTNVNGMANGLENQGFTSENNAHANGHAPDVHRNGNATFIVNQDQPQTSTKVDLGGPSEPSLGQKILLSFSVLTNGEKLFNFSSAGGLTCINGIRALSFGWVVLGHTYGFSLAYTDNALEYTRYLKMPAMQLIIQGTYAVDTFFFLSGLLVAYTTLKILKKTKGSLNWPLFYIHRYIRLTTLYGFTILFIATLYRHIIRGIFQNEIAVGGVTAPAACQKYWWTNILYINNFYPDGDEPSCHGVGWYMANDMQFFVFTPIYICLLYRKPLIGHIYVLKSILICFLATGIVSSIYDVRSLMISGEPQTTEQDKYQGYIYFRPYYRMGAYLIGLSTAEFLINKPKLNKAVISLGWLLAIGLHYTLLFGMYPYYEAGGISMSRHMDALYNATHRTVWCASVGWIIFACANGYGGPINWFLSWNIWGPLARLSFAGYLCHPMVMDVTFASLNKLIHLNDFSMAPIMRVQKLLLGDK